MKKIIFMEYSEAEKMIKKHQYLIGENLGEDEEVSHLIIVPSNRKHDVEIIERIYREKEIVDILSQYKEFNVIVVWGLDVYAQTGMGCMDTLENAIKKYNNK